MTFLDTIRLAFRNLGQAKLRTALTTLGVSIGIASLTGMVSFGVGLQDQLVGRFMSSGVFDSITVTSASLGTRMGGPGARGRGPATHAGGAGRSGGDSAAAPSDPPAERARLDDTAIEKLTALEHVTGVFPTLRLPVQMKLGDHTEFGTAAGVPLAAKSDGAFQAIPHGSFFANETDDACMVSLDLAKRLATGEPKDLIGQTLTLTYAAGATGTAPGQTAPLPTNIPGIPGIPLGGLQVRRVEYGCAIVGIAERETGPAIGLTAGVSPLMIPMAKARAIYAVQVTNAQSLLRGIADDRTYPSLTVKVAGPQHTQDVQERIKALGFSAFSLADALQGAKRAFLILDIILALVGSIALVVSSLGIVNTMVMSILERTREIGVMKAIGGSDSDIRRIFLIEASAIGVLGGAAGIVIGWIVGRVVNFGANLYIVRQGGTAGDLFSMPLWLVGSAVGFSLLVSLVAGSYPARRAARLDPIQALRHD